MEGSFRRGLDSEQNVAEALYRMMIGKEIDGFNRMPRYSLQDCQGIDFLVYYRGVTIPIQVKSNEYHKNLHEEYSDIDCIVGVLDNLTPRIKHLLREHCYRMRHHA